MGLWILKKNIEKFEKSFWKMYSIKSYREFPFSSKHSSNISESWIISILSVVELIQNQVPNDLMRRFYTGKFYFSFHACSAISPRMIRYPRNGSGRIWYLNFMVHAL